jgi:hypothetical protein
MGEGELAPVILGIPHCRNTLHRQGAPFGGGAREQMGGGRDEHGGSSVLPSRRGRQSQEDEG